MAELKLLSRSEAVDRIADLLRYPAPLRAEIFQLADGTFEGRLTVDPEIAFAALRQRGADDGRT